MVIFVTAVMPPVMAAVPSEYIINVVVVMVIFRPLDLTSQLGNICSLRGIVVISTE